MMKLRETIKGKAMFQNPINIGSIVPGIILGTFLSAIAWGAYATTTFILL